MKLPSREYTLDSFLEEIADNMDDIFGDEKERKWLKTYLMYCDENWLQLFQNYHPVKIGDLYRISMPFEEEHGTADYYVHEFEKGMLMFFTSSTRSDYVNTLKEFVGRKRGITEMWLPASSFDAIIDYILSTYEATIYSFISKRNWASKEPAKVRPDYSRMLHYSGDDANHVLREMRERYGILPTLVDFKIGIDKIRISNDGLFLVRTINRRMLRLVIEAIDKVLAEQIRINNISKKVRYTQKSMALGKNELNVSTLMSGRIVFSDGKRLSAPLVEKLFNRFAGLEIGQEGEPSEFSFIDTTVKEGSLSFSATIIDESKGTIFGLSGSETDMVLIPKHRTTFESFIRFFRLVNESIDSSSQLLLFSENIDR